MTIGSIFLSGLAAIACLGSGLPAAISGIKDDLYEASLPVTTLKIYNAADYIYKDEQLDESESGTIQLFKDYVKETDGVNLEVIYETFDTNEIMLSQLQTGASYYDLVCPSDYMVERMMSLGMLQPFKAGEERLELYGERAEGWDDNYEKYASPYLRNLLKGVTVSLGTDDGATGILDDYSRGYMWGTLGLIYNPSYSEYAERGLSEDQVKAQMADWDSLWDSHYEGTFQIKDSMRDTYAIGLMECYDGYFTELLSRYEAGTISEEEYNHDVTVIFNNIARVDEFNEIAKSLDPEADEETADSIIDHIQGYLTSLRDNSYGLEVDSGKTDIVTGSRVGLGIAWSGDAIFSMDTAEEENGINLYYSVPRTGGNVWLDVWVMPSNAENPEYAQKFIDFISRPDIAALNMDYIGYTPFIAGDDILDLVRLWYDPRMGVIYVYDETADDYAYDEEGNLIVKDGTGEKAVSVEDEDGVSDHTYDYGDVDFTSLSETDLNAFYNDCGSVSVTGWDYASWEAYSEENDLGWVKDDLSYFFNGSFENYQDGVDSVFYTDEAETVTAVDVHGEEVTRTVGRQFLAQYPPADSLPGLALMEDYGDSNSYVLRMWEAVKSGTIPVAVVVILSVELAIALILVGYYLFSKYGTKRLRERRRQARAEQGK
jgi:spermidine/putrescine transport system substrate-binding protein